MGSFLGSLLAGVLTLGGVYLTIKEQRFSQLLDRFPKMLIKIDKLHTLLHSPEIYGLLDSKEELNGSIMDGLENLNVKKVESLELASEVNADIYLSVKKIFNIVDESLENYPRSRINTAFFNQFTQDERLEWEEKQTEYNSRRRSAAIDILKEIETFDRKYEDFIKKHSKMLKINR